MLDPVHKYVVTARSWYQYGQNKSEPERYMLEMYSAQDAVDAVRTWLSHRASGGGMGHGWDRIMRVEPYSEEIHGQWIIPVEGPGRTHR